MKKSPDKGQDRSATWRGTAGSVDAAGEHIELRYGSAREAEYEQWTPVAIVGRPMGGTFPVRWLVDPTEDSDVAVATRLELDFYLVENPQRSLLDLDPWEYAVYHCGTTSNVYSDVHWSYFPQGGSMKSPTVAPKVETVTWPFDEAERDRWYARDESLLLGSPASAFIKRVIGQKHAKRPRRFFGEALVAAKTPHLEGYYCPFKWLTSSRWADRTELAGSDAREFREALERHFPRLGEFQQRAMSAANRLEGLEPYRFRRRAHSLRGCSPWQERASIHLKCESEPFGWSAIMAPSTRRSGRRLRRSRASSAAPRRPCATGCARRNAIRASAAA